MKNNRQGKRNHYRRKKREEVDIHEKTYSNVLTRMIDKYEPDDEDWMGFKLSNNNAYTFHHIRERRAGGKEEMENGAILTRFAHQFLNYLDLHNKRAYNDYQAIFRQINKNKGPIPDDLLEDIYGMMLDIFYYNDYRISNRELDYYEPFTNARPKTLIKK